MTTRPSIQINDRLEINADLREAMQAIFESANAADGDFGGEQREWHLPRLQRAMALLIKCFPNHAVEAMWDAKTPYGDLIAGDQP